MGTLFEGFQFLCTDYDHILGKRGDSIQGRTLYKGGHYSRKYGSSLDRAKLKVKNFQMPRSIVHSGIKAHKMVIGYSTDISLI